MPDDSAVRTSAARKALLHTVFRVTVGSLLTPALTISRLGTFGHLLLVIPALRAWKAVKLMVIVLHEVSSFTWDTFAFTMVPLAWLEDVGASGT